MLLDCKVKHEQRTVLFERVAATMERRVEITLSLLLGFHKSQATVIGLFMKGDEALLSFPRMHALIRTTALPSRHITSVPKLAILLAQA